MASRFCSSSAQRAVVDAFIWNVSIMRCWCRRLRRILLFSPSDIRELIYNASDWKMDVAHRQYKALLRVSLISLLFRRKFTIIIWLIAFGLIFEMDVLRRQIYLPLHCSRDIMTLNFLKCRMLRFQFLDTFCSNFTRQELWWVIIFSCSAPSAAHTTLAKALSLSFSIAWDKLSLIFFMAGFYHRWHRLMVKCRAKRRTSALVSILSSH